MGKTIESVAVERKIMMKENFRKKGLPELLSEVNFSIDTTASSREILKKFVSAVKRRFKKDFFSLSFEDRLNYFNRIQTNDTYTVELKELEPNKEQFNNYIKALLNRLQSRKDRRRSLDDVHVVQVKINNSGVETIGYALLDGDIASTYHRSKRAFVGRSPYGHLLCLDIASLIAETIVTQSLISFAENNKELVEYLYVKYRFDNPIATTASAVTYTMPKEPEFQKDFLAVCEKYNLDTSKLTPHEYSEGSKNVFYHEYDKMSFSIRGTSLFQLIVGDFISQSDYVQYKTAQQIKERSDYASSFQTKKAIKKTHLEKMKNNEFLNRYGYVELDNDVDLYKFRIIEDNLRELCEVIHIPMRKDYNFRIKKLGKHKAAGVFFPYFRTTIFDLHHPNAFVHELGHQVDHMLAEDISEDFHSELIEFRPVLDMYKRLVMKKVDSLDKDDNFKMQWDGGTKFNKSYYMQPTEVFARSYEIYLATKGVKNSLLKSEEELKSRHVYPFDDLFIELITHYYDNLLAELAKKYPAKPVKLKKKKITRSAASPIVFDEPTITGSEQLSLFDFQESLFN